MVRRSPWERFWEKVDASGDCWEWQAACSKQGYGNFWSGGARSEGSYLVAHRWAYETLVGPIPEHLQADHLCRVRHCVNPDHIELVTSAENTRRGTHPYINGSWHAAKTHCPQGHPYDEKNTYRRPGYTSRACRECSRQSDRRRYAELSGRALRG